MAVVASRSSLVGALLRSAVPSHRHLVFEFLRGLSRDELECIAEFQGACILECESNPYRLMPEFFEAAASDRWFSEDDRAHKTFVVLEYLDHLEGHAVHHSAVNS